MAGLCVASLGGCVCHGAYTTCRKTVERHPLRGNQAVMTVSGQIPPPAREVHHARLNHGAPRRHQPPGPAFPWLPGAVGWAVARTCDAGHTIGCALDGAKSLLEKADAARGDAIPPGGVGTGDPEPCSAPVGGGADFDLGRLEGIPEGGGDHGLPGHPIAGEHEDPSAGADDVARGDAQ
ncbi:hypothetical protein LzC2_04730 [Planctomycetes bacterium LzC2]|uniref:Uncharacterized protein n=1 Tax=Alienimonas chondri TaxID=2681879 RepID=A0ABX1V8Y4_9PLAN|nr:hypothetical protein [Alienimonas chondri]